MYIQDDSEKNRKQVKNEDLGQGSPRASERVQFEVFRGAVDKVQY